MSAVAGRDCLLGTAETATRESGEVGAREGNKDPREKVDVEREKKAIGGKDLDIGPHNPISDNKEDGF